MKENKQNIKNALQALVDNLDNPKQVTKSQEKILDAALKLFADRGFEASSTADIAKEAGVAEVTLFRNFKSKNNLLYHILAPIFIQFNSKKYVGPLQEIFEEGSNKNTKEVLKSAFNERLNKLAENQKVVKILLQESYLQPEIKNAIEKYITTPATDSIKTFIRHKKEQGEFSDYNEVTITNLFFYLLFGYIFINYILQDKTSTDESELDELLDIILKGLRKS
ncbi:TetR/AcrR family transcriptional regulator [Pallidibacillus pasinlerensis]|uniref:TetR/AcrR family transcriptional regulator n=1 Tax=Pallidibacillus pasinlerensis TaxID=2703818 RepID=A0ABX0A8R2_9BACI|nr:TetR/AcrR family transcriptional regulator [Pallidibacillus pasinlerensis]NCU17512.1 TetR/AcrR family transcriptional regulator [Pallidibacillus pasinlerensis]